MNSAIRVVTVSDTARPSEQCASWCTAVPTSNSQFSLCHHDDSEASNTPCRSLVPRAKMHMPHAACQGAPVALTTAPKAATPMPRRRSTCGWVTNTAGTPACMSSCLGNCPGLEALSAAAPLLRLHHPHCHILAQHSPGVPCHIPSTSSCSPSTCTQPPSTIPSHLPHVLLHGSQAVVILLCCTAAVIGCFGGGGDAQNVVVVGVTGDTRLHAGKQRCGSTCRGGRAGWMGHGTSRRRVIGAVLVGGPSSQPAAAVNKHRKHSQNDSLFETTYSSC
jgi:hypothetical protein